MKYLVYIIALIISVALTVGLFGNFRLAGVVPDLILLLVVVAAVELESRDFLFLSLAGGIWMDIFYGLPIGSFALGYALCGSLAYALFHSAAALEFNWKYFLSLVAGALILLYGWLWLYTNLLAAAHLSPLRVNLAQTARHFLFILIYNLILAFPVYWAFTRASRLSAKISRKPLQL